MKNKMKLNEKVNTQVLVTFLGLLFLMLFFTLTTKRFMTSKNLINIALQTSVSILVALAESFVIISGGIDLAIGSSAAGAGMVVAMSLNAGIPVPGAILLGLLTGILCGAINGLVVTYLHIVPFIATLGTNSILRGLIYVMLGGIPLSISAPNKTDFTWIGQGRLGGWLPWPVVFMIIISIISIIVLTKTQFGRNIFAIGSNEGAAFLSGVNVKSTKFFVYILCGLLSGIAGIVLTARVSSAAPTACEGYETYAIAAAVIGGASMAGGKGDLVGTLVGAFIIGIMNNGLNLIGLSSYWQQVAVGLVIVLAVFLDVIRTRIQNE